MAMALNSTFDVVAAAEALLEDAQKLVRITKTGADGDELAIRRRIAQVAKTISFETAPPIDVVKSDWVVLANVAAWNVFIDWHAFDHIPIDGHISIADLAHAINAQESLVARIATHLLSTRILSPGPSPGTLAHSRISPLYMTSNPVSALAVVAVGNGMKPYAHWPSYFRAYGRCEPRGQTHTPFSFGWGKPELPPWEVKALDPVYASMFARSMQSRAIVGGDTRVCGGREEGGYNLRWVGEEAKRLGEGEEVVVVDVGGGLGQLLRDVVRDVEGVKAKQCVLQDRREVIEEAREKARESGLEGVVMMEHDFHQEQPVKGALVYLLRRILLDYSDELAANILRHLADALPANNPKARVVIIEERRLDVPTPQNCIVDLVMLNLGGKLRNKVMFEDIAGKAGLRVVGYHTRDGDPSCVVECAKA
ncbi:hypothetical protein VTI74DRAFT_11052 [Chaetomium olivicolor]